MNFGEAIEALKKGEVVRRREAWGEYYYLCLFGGSQSMYPSLWLYQTFDNPPAIYSHIVEHGWIPRRPDLFADDWSVACEDWVKLHFHPDCWAESIWNKSEVGLSFSEAFKEMKRGKSTHRRKQWSDGYYLNFARGTNNRHPSLWMYTILNRPSPNNLIVQGWLPSCADLLNDDWGIADTEWVLPGTENNDSAGQAETG